MNNVIIVDFDNTICFGGWVGGGIPTKGCKEALTKLREKGFEIHILSCRTSVDVFPNLIDRIEQVRKMEKFLKDNEIPFDKILDCEKPVAKYYIDDRGIGFRGDWDKVIEEIKSGF